MPWHELLLAALSGSLVTALLNVGFNAWNSQRQWRNKQAELQAQAHREHHQWVKERVRELTAEVSSNTSKYANAFFDLLTSAPEGREKYALAYREADDALVESRNHLRMAVPPCPDAQAAMEYQRPVLAMMHERALQFADGQPRLTTEDLGDIRHALFTATQFLEEHMADYIHDIPELVFQTPKKPNKPSA